MQPAATPAEVQERLAELSAATWTLAAIGAAVEFGFPALMIEPVAAETLSHATGVSPPLAERLAEALVSAGLAERADDGFVAAPGLAAVAAGVPCEILQADLRSGLLQSAALFDQATTGTASPAWSHTDERVLQAQGRMSSAPIDFLETQAFPNLPGVVERLDSGEGVFLDVGAGVASVTIELCRRHPTLRAIALEPQAAPFALAQRNIAEAGLGERIELRRQLVEDLPDEAVCDLAWLPGNFLPPEVLPQALAAVHRALRPGGWLLNATLGGGADDARSVAARLRAVLWGGDVLAPERAAEQLADVGFVDVRLLPRLATGLVPMYARRP